MEQKKKIIIMGASVFAEEVADIISQTGNMNLSAS